MARFIEDHGAFEHIIEETTTHVKFDAYDMYNRQKILSEEDYKKLVIYDELAYQGRGATKKQWLWLIKFPDRVEEVVEKLRI